MAAASMVIRQDARPQGLNPKINPFLAEGNANFTDVCWMSVLSQAKYRVAQDIDVSGWGQNTSFQFNDRKEIALRSMDTLTAVNGSQLV